MPLLSPRQTKRIEARKSIMSTPVEVLEEFTIYTARVDGSIIFVKDEEKKRKNKVSICFCAYATVADYPKTRGLITPIELENKYRTIEL